jgi:hypothetical protein
MMFWLASSERLRREGLLPPRERHDAPRKPRLPKRTVRRVGFAVLWLVTLVVSLGAWWFIVTRLWRLVGG